MFHEEIVVVGSETDVVSREVFTQSRFSFKRNDKMGGGGTRKPILAKNKLMYL
jgi:hypothetical protein